MHTENINIMTVKSKGEIALQLGWTIIGIRNNVRKGQIPTTHIMQLCIHTTIRL